MRRPAARSTVSGGNTQIGSSGNRVGTNGLVFFNVTGDLNFTTLGVSSDVNTAVSIGGTGALGAVTGTGITTGSGSVIVAAAGAAVDLSNLTAAVQLTALTSTNSAVNGVALTNVGGSFGGAGIVDHERQQRRLRDQRRHGQRHLCGHDHR